MTARTTTTTSWAARSRTFRNGVQEFQIITNRFSADIGRSASSAINVVTKTGGNELHGAAGFYFRHDALSALPATLDRGVRRARAAVIRPRAVRRLGGPLKRDKLWFFSAFEYRFQDAVLLTGVRDLSQRRILTSFSPAPLRDTLLTGRGDWQTTANDRMAFRYALQRENDMIAAAWGAAHRHGGQPPAVVQQLSIVRLQLGAHLLAQVAQRLRLSRKQLHQQDSDLRREP